MGVPVYWLVQRSRGKLKTESDRRNVRSRIIYATLLFLNVVLPSISIVVISFFSCPRFDRGDESDLRVITSALEIKCTSPKYRRWSMYAGLMIILYPVGATFGLAVLLWSHRGKLNPAGDNLPDQVKYDLRDADESIDSLKFLFEEYKPSRYLFPVFEMARRLFLSSALAIVYPGNMQQVVVGLLGAMLSSHQCRNQTSVFLSLRYRPHFTGPTWSIRISTRSSTTTIT